MRKFVTTPVVYPLITVIVIYGALGIATANTHAAYIITSIIWYLYTLFFWIVILAFLRDYLQNDIPFTPSIIGFLNILFVALHVTAAFGMTFWMLDFSPDKNEVFLGIPPSIKTQVYRVFLAEFLPTACEFVQTGSNTLQFVPGSIVAALWVYYGLVTAVATFVFLFTFVSRSAIRNQFVSRRYTNKV